MRALTYLPVTDFIIFFISSSRDFHASPSLLKTGPLLLAAPCPRPWPLIPFQISSRSPPRRPRARRTCSPRWRPWSPGRRLRSRAGRTRGTGRHRASRPPRRRGRRHGATPGTAARPGQASPGPSGTRVRRCPLLSPSSLANSRISTTSVRPLRASTVLASMPAGISCLRARAVGDTPRRAASPTLPTRATSPPMCSAMPAVHPRSVPDQPRPLLRPRGSQVRHLLGLDASYV